ncbi:MAG: hypothetical protein ABII90_07145 [Bacteroidota bacterium]
MGFLYIIIFLKPDFLNPEDLGNLLGVYYLYLIFPLFHYSRQMNPQKAHKMIKVAEILWLIIAILSILAGAYETKIKGIGESYMFFIFTFVAGIMYALRRWKRIKIEKKQNDL